MRLLVKMLKRRKFVKKCQTCAFMDLGPSLGNDISTKQNIDEDSFLRILASNVVQFLNKRQLKKIEKI